MKKNAITLIVVFLLLITSSVSAKPKQKIIFGIIPLESRKIMFTKFLPLAHYLSTEIGIEIVLKIGRNYQEIMDAMGEESIAIAYMTPTTYTMTEAKHPSAKIEPVIRFLREGKSTFKSCIIVNQGSNIKNIEDIKGQKFAFGSINSTSSHLIPRHMLLNANIDPEKDLDTYQYLGSHTNVANAVVRGDFAAGGVQQSVAEKYLLRGSLNIIMTSKPLPQFPICINNKLPEDIKNKIIKALLKLNDNSRKSRAILSAIDKKYTGCEKTESKDYDIIREMSQTIYNTKNIKKEK